MLWPVSLYRLSALLLLLAPLVGLALVVGVFRERLRREGKLAVALTLLALSFLWVPLVYEGRVLAQIDWTFATLHFGQVYRRAMLALEPPLWNPYLGGGVPALGNPLFPAFYPLSPLFLLPEPDNLAAFLIAHLVVGTLGAYILARQVRLPPGAAAVAAVVFMFNEWVVRRLHPEIAAHYVLAYVWLPWSLALLERAWQRPGRWALWALAGLPLSWSLAIQPNLFAYGVILLVLWGGLRWLLSSDRRDQLARLPWLALPVLSALVLSTAELLPAVEQTLASFPGDRALGAVGGWRAEAIQPGEFARLVFPSPERPFAKPFTPGFLAVALVLASLFGWRRARTRFLWLLLGLGSLLWLETPLLPLLTRLIPGLDRVTRLPTALVLLLVPLSLLAGEGARALTLWLARWRKTGRLGLATFVFLELVLYPGFLLPGLSGRLPRGLLSRPDTLPAGELRDFPHLAAIGIGANEFVRIACYPQPYGGLCPPYAMPAFDLGLYSMAIRTYMALPPRHYLGSEYLFEEGSLPPTRLLDMAGVVYVASAERAPALGEPAGRVTWEGVRDHLDEGMKIHLRPLWEAGWNGEVWIYRRPDSLWPARVVDRAVVFSGPLPAVNGLSLSTLRWEGFDPRTAVVLTGHRPAAHEHVQHVELKDAALEDPLATPRISLRLRPLSDWDEAASIESFLGAGGEPRAPVPRVTRSKPHRWEIEGRSPGSAFLYLPETFFPDWSARVNGRPVPVYRANFSFMAVPVPQGDFHVRLQYQPWSFLAGLLVAVAWTGALVVTLLAGSRRRRDVAVDRQGGQIRLDLPHDEVLEAEGHVRKSHE